MKNSLETKLGIFVVLVVFAAWAIMETLGGMEMFAAATMSTRSSTPRRT